MNKPQQRLIDRAASLFEADEPAHLCIAADGRVLDVDDAAEEMLERPRPELTGRVYRDVLVLLDPQSRSYVQHIVEECLCGAPENSLRRDCILALLNGRELAVRVELRLYSENDARLAFVRLRRLEKIEPTAESQIARQIGHYSASLDLMPDNICELDRNGTILFHNHPPLGLPAGDYRGRNLFDLLEENMRHILRRTLDQAHAGGKATPFEIRSRMDGHTRWWNGIVIPHEVDGGIRRFVCLGRDVTAARNVQEERERHLQALQELDRLSRRMAAMEDVDDIDDTIADALRDMLDCDRVYLLALDRDTMREADVVADSRSDKMKALTPDRRLQLTDEVAARFRQVFSSGVTLRFDPETGRQIQHPVQESAAGSEMLTSVTEQTNGIWFLGAHSSDAARVWRTWEFRLIRNVAERLEGHIQRMLLLRALRRNEHRFRVLAEIATDFCFHVLIDNSGAENILWHTEEVREFAGVSAAEMAAGGLLKTLFGAESERVVEHLRVGRFPERRERTWRPERARKRQVVDMLRARKQDDGFHIFGAIRDVSARYAIQERLQAGMVEQEAMVREIHHRVKNNLQIVSSLLNIQMRTIKEEHYRSIFRESRSRIRSMALIHDKLYHSDNLARIDFSTYVHSLVRELRRSFGVHEGSVATDVDIEQLFLSVQQAVPCGLVINELVNNSLKYAFPEEWRSGGRQARISIAMRVDPDEGGRKYRLTIADNGVGLPAAATTTPRHTAIGLQLVSMLLKQIDGTLRVDRQHGTTCEIRF